MIPDIFANDSWNAGDLAGRLVCGIKRLTINKKPNLLAVISACRVLYIPLFLLCNYRQDQSPVIASDLFYLMVQFTFGLSNGWLSVCTLQSASESVVEDERPATGGFMR